MFCNHCGAQIPETSKFCPKCGSTVAEAVQMQAGRAQQERKAADAHPDSQTPQDPERYQQLLALKAKQDTERALQEAETAQRQAEEARRKAAEAQKKYAEQYGGPQPAQGQQAPAQSTQAARAVPAEAAGASVPGDARPVVAEKKKKRLLPLILGLAALVSCAAIALILLWPTLFGEKDSDTGRNKDKDKVSADTIDDTKTPPDDETARPNPSEEPSEPVEETSEYAGTYDITVWVSDQAVSLTRYQIDEFNRTNTEGITFNAVITGVSEADAAQLMLSDVYAGADLYCFAQDQIARLLRAGTLSYVPADAASAVRTENAAGVVAAVTSGGNLCAYPMTSDNGYFMYYDKSVIPEENVDSLEKLIADCERADKHFCMENESSAWYLASWFFGAGCHSDWITDDAGNFIGIDDDFNSNRGLITVKGMKKLLDSPAYLSSSNVEGFYDGSAAVLVSGTWCYEDARYALGDNLGCADLPSFEVDGISYHLGSFNGCKLMGVKPCADARKAAVLHKLAQFLTDETRQMERFYELAWGPSNLAAQNDPAVQANPAQAALLAQNRYSLPQGQIEGNWWDIAKRIGDGVRMAKDEAGLKQALVDYENSLTALFNRTAAEKNAWSVIGEICGTNWDTDFPMTEIGDGFWQSDPLVLHAGEQLKCRKGGSWDENYGPDGLDGANLVVPFDGTYCVLLDLNEETISLVP